MVIYKQAKSIAEIVDILRLRIEVFVVEQGYRPDLEPDDYDKIAMHWVALEDNRIVSYARVIATGKEYRIGRMVTKKEYRGKGIAKGLVSFIIKKLLKKKPKRIWLHAQVPAEKFYLKCGFKTVSERFDY